MCIVSAVTPISAMPSIFICSLKISHDLKIIQCQFRWAVVINIRKAGLRGCRLTDYELNIPITDPPTDRCEGRLFQSIWINKQGHETEDKTEIKRGWIILLCRSGALRWPDSLKRRHCESFLAQMSSVLPPSCKHQRKEREK